MAVELSRVVAVETSLAGGRLQVGSGFIVSEGLVLTAAHCTRDKRSGAPAESIRVVRATDGAAIDVGAESITAAESVDVAAIRLPLLDWTAGIASVPFARVDRDHTGVLDDCVAVGYPLYQIDSVRMKRGTGELHGRIYQTDGHEAGRLLLRELSFTPGDFDGELENAEGGAWGGLSGAVVFHNDHAIGVVLEHHPRQGDASVQLAAIDRLLTTNDGAALSALLGLSHVDQMPWAAASPSDRLSDLVEVSTDGALPTIEALDPYQLGATTSLAGDSTRYREADPYVPRTAGQADERLEQAVAAALDGGPMIVVVGPSKAGKTRTAYEALRRLLPQARLAAPVPGMLNELAAHQLWHSHSDPIVVWLDDLNRFITHAHPLTPSVLTTLRKRSGPVVVLATLRSEERGRLRGVGELNRDSRLLFEQSYEIALGPTSHDPTETQAAHALYPGVRLDAGLAAELAGAPELLRQYDDAEYTSPLRRAVVETAIDWARVGRPDPIPEPVLIALAKEMVFDHWPYLDAEDAAIESAIKDARTPPAGLGRVAMLDTLRQQGGLRGYRPFDYLVAADDSPPPRRAIVDWFWPKAIKDATPDTAFAVGLVALLRGRLNEAADAWRLVAEAGHDFAMNLLGLLELQRVPPRPTDAQAWFEKAASRGNAEAMKHLASIAEKSDPPDRVKAKSWYQRAAETYEKAAENGDTDAMISLGALFADQTDPPDLAAARTWYEKAAHAGNTDAMVRLGALFANRTDPPDLTAARTWYEKAAHAGNTDAMTNLGYMLQRLNPPDLTGAYSWWEKAANAGNVHAMTNFASLLSNDWDPLDIPAARSWYEKAANAGDVRAMAYLGTLLLTKWEPPEVATARQWLKIASAGGRTDAMINLGLTYMSEDPPDLSQTRGWFERAAEAGDTEAMWRLGALHVSQYDPPDLTTARTWYEKGANAGDATAMTALARLLTDRWDPPDLAGARFWYEKAATSGDSDAMTALGSLLTTRWDPPELATARLWYEKAAEAGNAEAMYNLGVLLTDYWKPPDLPTARSWYESAAEMGYTTAMLNLGALLANRWIPPDFSTARSWYEKAAEGGNVDAMFNLGWLLVHRYQPPDITAARSWWEKAASGGDVRAMTALAWLIAELCTPSELLAARELAEKAADLGHTEAMSWLAFSFLRLSEPPDLAAARTWYEKAAESAEPQPMYDLGVFLADFWAPPDLPQARFWLQKAADAGHLDAMGFPILLASRPPGPS